MLEVEVDVLPNINNIEGDVTDKDDVVVFDGFAAEEGAAEVGVPLLLNFPDVAACALFFSPDATGELKSKCVAVMDRLIGFALEGGGRLTVDGVETSLTMSFLTS